MPQNHAKNRVPDLARTVFQIERLLDRQVPNPGPLMTATMHAPSPRPRFLAPQQPLLASLAARRLMSRLNGVDNARTGRGRINRVARTMSRSEKLRGDSRMVGIPEVVGYTTGLVRFVTARSTTPAIGQQIVDVQYASTQA